MSPSLSRPGAPTLRRLALLGGLAVLVLGALVVLRLNAEVIEEGLLLDHTTAPVERVRLFGAFDVYIEPGIGRYDAIAAMVLAVLAGVSAVGWFAVAGAARFFALVTVGALAAGLDEMLGLHESAGHNMTFLAELPLIQRPDDVFMGLYVVAAVALVWSHRRAVRSSRVTRLLVVAGLGLFAGAGAMDVLTAHELEEVVELLGTVVLLAGFLLLVVEQLPRAAGADEREELAGVVIQLPVGRRRPTPDRVVGQ